MHDAVVNRSPDVHKDEEHDQAKTDNLTGG